MKKNIFEEDLNPLDYDYPHLEQYMDAIHDSFWKPSHFRYDRDVNDFKMNLLPHEKTAIERSMLSISLVENKVKTFWARVDMRLPKTVVALVGHTFGGNESIHMVTYQKLLKLLGLEKVFSTIDEIPCMEGRVKYLTKYLDGLNSRSHKEFTKSLILFTLLVENCSLFSQFLIVSSFNKYTNRLTNFSTVVGATAKEENLHAQFGAELIKIIKQENPEWFDLELEQKTRRAIRKAFKAEVETLDWIFEEGELEFMPKNVVVNYLKHRFNLSLALIGYDEEYEVDEKLLEQTEYFERSTKCSVSFDFFNESNVDYDESNKITEEDWN